MLPDLDHTKMPQGWQQPFQKRHMHQVSMTCLRMADGTWRHIAFVSYAAGKTTGKQHFEAKTLPDLMQQIQDFSTSLPD